MKPAERRLLGILLAAYLILSVGYSLSNPLYESTDELRHMRYVRHIVEYGNLPVQAAGGPRAQSHHPPLYYALGALVSCWVPVEEDVYYQPAENPFWAYRYWEIGNDNKNQYLHEPDEPFPLRGIGLAVYLVRWMTVLIGAGVVWLTYRLGRLSFHEQPALALGAAILVAFNPQFLYLSGAVNNDILAALCGTAVLLLCVRLIREGPSLRMDLTLGIAFGLSLLTKFHLLALLAPIGLAYFLAAWSSDKWRVLLRGSFVIMGVTALLSGWWFLRNLHLYGDLTGLNRVSQLWAGRSFEGNWWVIGQQWPHLWSSFWGRFGYGQVPLPEIIYHGLLAFCLIALGGYFLSRWRLMHWNTLLPLTVTVLAFTLIVLYYMLIQPAGAMGRFLFPALPAFAVLLAGGLSRFSPARLGWITVAGIAVVMTSLATYSLVGVLRPAFAPPRPLDEAEIAAVPNPVSVDFSLGTGDTAPTVARLLGYRIVPKEIRPGDTVEVTLYWKALARTREPQIVFVHLMSDVGTIIAQRDTYPGLGRYPTTAWNPGVAFVDTYRVPIPDSAYAPDSGYVQVGLYSSQGPRLTTGDGQDAVKLARLTVHPRGGDVPNALKINFEDKIALIGYELDQRVAEPGETIQLTLYWQALNPMEADYNVFAHVLGQENQIWANSDGPVSNDGAHTSQWSPGTVVKEVRYLSLAEATPTNLYEIELGVYVRGQDHLRILADDGRQLDNRALLTSILILKPEQG